MDYRAKASVLLLFPRGGRPDIPTVKETIKTIGGISVSAEPRALSNSDALAGNAWVELLCEGMTFDLCGLAEGPSVSIPAFIDPSGALDGHDALEAIELKLGPHLHAGGRSLPIVRSMLAVGATLAGHLNGLIAASWPASGTCLSPMDFSQSIDAWLQGGTLPSPALIAFRNILENGLQSTGLALFCDQELLMEPDLAISDDDVRRLGIRIASQLIHQGRLENIEELSAPDGGMIRLTPFANGKYIRASRC